MFEPGVTYGEIAEQVGNPNGLLGSVNIGPFYMLEDGSYIQLDFNFTFLIDISDGSAADKIVGRLIHVTPDDTGGSLWTLLMPDGPHAFMVYRAEPCVTPVGAFANLQVGMSSSMVYARIGAPTASVVVGWEDIYKMKDGSIIIVRMQLADKDAESLFCLAEVYHLNADGSKTPIVPAATD